MNRVVLPTAADGVLLRHHVLPPRPHDQLQGVGHPRTRDSQQCLGLFSGQPGVWIDSSTQRSFCSDCCHRSSGRWQIWVPDVGSMATAVCNQLPQEWWLTSDKISGATSENRISANLFYLRTFCKCDTLRICNLKAQSFCGLKISASQQIHTFSPYKYKILCSN